MRYKKVKFENGLRLVTCPMSEMRSISIGVWVGVGGRHEEDSLSGVSHFLEHMLFKGTKRRTAAQISQAIEGVGGSMNAFTTEENTCFYVKVMSDHFSQAIDVLADMFRDPSFLPKDIDRERRVILEELRMNIDQPSHYVFELLRNVMWPKHPLGRMLIGTEETIRDIRRQNLIKFKGKHYTAENIVISIAGHMNENKIIKEIRKKFLFLRRNGLPKYLHVRNGQKDPQSEVLFKKTEQTHFCIGVHALHRDHPDRFALRVLNVILGENMSSRLFQEIREKAGLSYDINSSVERFLDTGALIISAGVDIRQLPRAIDKTLAELLKLKKKAVSKRELEMAKEYCIGQTSLAVEKTSSQMIYMGDSELCSGEILSVDNLISEIRKVNSEDVQRVSQELFVNQKLSLAVIGPVTHKEKIKNLFGLN